MGDRGTQSLWKEEETQIIESGECLQNGQGELVRKIVLDQTEWDIECYAKH